MLLIIMAKTTAFGQKIVSPDFVVTIGNDTINGRINEDKLNDSVCEIQLENGKVVQYAADQLLFYSVGGHTLFKKLNIEN